ncbi:ETX/MTX2 family pore-forming toxin [Tenacibaculum sp. C7A-26P2]|uniref:ETX/MTX2 family pore-forming toxin n=1 Tax=Tenacibaculum sp. C7A-26P2 TaxID=3447504 RepID=UPI003F859EFD
MKNKLILMSSALLFATFFSCQNQEEEIMSSPSQQKDRGIKVGKTINIKYFDVDTSHRSKAPIVGEWQKISGKHLKTLSRDVNFRYDNEGSAKARFAEILNSGSQLPVGVFINDRGLGWGTNPNPSQYWEAEFRPVGESFYDRENISDYTPWKPIEETISVRNYDNEPRRMEAPIKWEFRDTHSVKYEVGGSLALTAGGKIGLPLVAEGETSVTATLSASYSDTSTTTKIITIGGSATGIMVPGRKKVTWTLYERHKNFDGDWRVPVEFRGEVGADYGAGKYKGHHFWYVHAADFFREFKNPKNAYQISVFSTIQKQFEIRAVIHDN